MKPSLDLRRIMRTSLRLYFAPLTGAVRGVRAEWRRDNRQMRLARNAQAAAEPKTER